MHAHYITYYDLKKLITKAHSRAAQNRLARVYSQHGLEVKKLFHFLMLTSPQLSMKFSLLINLKMPTNP